MTSTLDTAFSRRRFLKAALGGAGAIAAVSAFGLSGCGTSSSAGSSAGKATYDIAIGHLNSTAHLLAFVGKEEGFFEQEGVNATLTQLSSQAELVSGLEANKLQVVFLGSVPALVNQSNGHDISIFGGAMTNGHGVVIKAKSVEGVPDDKIDVTVLKGKNVAVPRTTVQELELYQNLANHGLTYGENDGSDVNIVHFESQKDAYNALSSDQVDAVTVYSPYTSIAVAAGHKVVYTCSQEEAFKNQPCCRQVALTSALKDNPDQFVAFERAVIKAYAFYKDDANKDKVIADVKKYIDIPEQQLEYEIFTPDYCDSNPDPDKQATEQLKQSAVGFGYLQDFDLDAHYNLDIYQQALTALMSEDSGNTYYQGLHDHFVQYE